MTPAGYRAARSPSRRCASARSRRTRSRQSSGSPCAITPRSRWNTSRWAYRAAGSRRKVSGGRTSPNRSPHHSPGSGSSTASRWAGNRRPSRSRRSGTSTIGGTRRRSRSTTTSRRPAACSTRVKVARSSAVRPASARLTVLALTARAAASSRWLIRSRRRTRRRYPTWSSGGCGRLVTTPTLPRGPAGATAVRIGCGWRRSLGTEPAGGYRLGAGRRTLVPREEVGVLRRFALQASVHQGLQFSCVGEAVGRSGAQAGAAPVRRSRADPHGARSVVRTQWCTEACRASGAPPQGRVGCAGGDVLSVGGVVHRGLQSKAAERRCPVSGLAWGRAGAAHRALGTGRRFGRCSTGGAVGDRVEPRWAAAAARAVGSRAGPRRVRDGSAGGQPPAGAARQGLASPA